jgi:hypothetical protein
MRVIKIFFLLVLVSFFSGCKEDEAGAGVFELQRIFMGATEITTDGSVTNNLPVGEPITLVFSSPLNKTSASSSIFLKKDGQAVNTNLTFSSGDKTVIIFPAAPLINNTTYTISLSDQLQGSGGEQFSSKEFLFKTKPAQLEIVSLKMGETTVSGTDRVMDIPLDLTVTINFSLPVTEASAKTAVRITGPIDPTLQYTFSNNNQTATITVTTPLKDLSKYELSLLTTLKGTQGESFSGYTKSFYTTVSATPKFPEISDEALLLKVEEQTFKYFWDFAHPASGMARERNSSNNIVTSGGSGFGIMALVVGMERNFITRVQGLERMDKILDFLETADRFHGAWSHWIDGNTGDVIPFSASDNGGDLVETAFLVEGLITFRQYLNPGVAAEQNLVDRINTLWEAVEWDWYQQDNKDVLYWHWSPTFDWAMNHQIKGWNECLITYVLAASSPTHGITKDVYDLGWASSGNMKNGNTYEGITLPLGFEYGGPLFFTHYSFLGFDPRELSDSYANYWTQNVNHSLINYKYCVRNPKDFVGYGENCWGLTASDNHLNYAAHSPTNDLGVITPTAALSSFPYTPEESMKALKFFYYKIGDRLWGEYGFYDAFNLTEGWTANSYLAIDQGPIIVMIENYRTGLLWELFMSAPEVQNGKTTLGFSD